MCVLVIGWRTWPGQSLVLAANRDEAYARPAVAPERLEVETGGVLAPRDLHAGGTWEGVTTAGLAVVITNRRDGDFEASRPSRGILCRAALFAPHAGAVRRLVETETSRSHYNSFNLFYADGRRAFVSSWNGTLQTRELDPGVYVLSNEHSLGELEIPELATVDWAAPRKVLRSHLGGILGDHTPRGPRGFRICKHGTTHGTVSSTRMFTDGYERFELDYAPGPPCRGHFEHQELALGLPATTSD